MRVIRFITIIAVAASILAGCGSPNDGDPEEEALQVVEASYDTYNDGDLEGWVEIRDRGSFHASDADRELALERMRADFASGFEAGARYEQIQCESHGDGEWPIADEGPVSGYYFTCDTRLVDDEGPIHTEAFEWVVRDGEVIAVRSDR